MRNLLVVIAVFSFFSYAEAQKKNVNKALTKIDGGKLAEADALLEPTKDNPESKDLASTWFAFGRLFEAIEASNDSALMAKYPDAVQKAYESYNKALTINKVEILTKYDEHIRSLYNVCLQNGSKAYETKKYPKSYTYYSYALKLNDDPNATLKLHDTIVGLVSYYIGLSAYQATMYPEAIKGFDLALKKQQTEVWVYRGLYYSYLQTKDTVKAEEIILTGIKQRPDETILLIDLANLYISTNKADKAVLILDEAIKKDPGNALLYYTKGGMYDQLNKRAEAEAAYTQAIEHKPDYYDALFNLGVLRYNWGQEYNNQAAVEKNDAKYNDLIAKRDDMYKKAIEPFEKALLLSPKDVDLLTALKKVYYKLKMKDKIDEMDKRLKEVQ